MSQPPTALRVEGVAKQYRIYEYPSDRLKESLTRGRWKLHREFWALRGVSFEIARGTTTGIVGPNGSGKSTLLQIVTGTLEPTHGSVWLAGRVAALLELGAGFNPEFTGLENVFMNASLMGFARRDTEARLADIERFAEIGDFIHQPVKTYSSGMYVRLAFAIAVNTDPEILVVDEALSVGDTVFQHRCVRRIKEMQARGTTILFVSHEPTLVRALCTRAIMLNAGEVVADGAPVDVLNRYQKLIMARERNYDDARTAHHTTSGVATNAAPVTPINESGEDTQDTATNGGAITTARTAVPSLPEDNEDAEKRAPLNYSYRHGDRSAEVIAVELLDAAGRTTELAESGEPLRLRLQILFHRDVPEPVCGFMIRSRHGLNVYGTNTEQRGHPLGAARRGEIIEAEFAFDCWLGQEHYFISVAAHSPDGVAFDWLDGVIFLRVACPVEMEGIANLNARATARRISNGAETSETAQNDQHPDAARAVKA